MTSVTGCLGDFVLQPAASWTERQIAEPLPLPDLHYSERGTSTDRDGRPRSDDDLASALHRQRGASGCSLPRLTRCATRTTSASSSAPSWRTRSGRAAPARLPALRLDPVRRGGLDGPADRRLPRPRPDLHNTGHGPARGREGSTQAMPEMPPKAAGNGGTSKATMSSQARYLRKRAPGRTRTCDPELMPGCLLSSGEDSRRLS